LTKPVLQLLIHGEKMGTVICRGITRRGAQILGCWNIMGGAKKSQQCHKCFLQYSTFAS